MRRSRSALRPIACASCHEWGPRRGERIQIVLVLVAALVLRLTYWAGSPLPGAPDELGLVWTDEGTYFSVSTYLLNNGFWQYLISEQSVWVAPGNPIYLAAWFAVTGTIDAIRMINVLLSCAVVFFVYAIGTRWLSHKVALVAAILCAIHGQLIQYSPTLLTEPVFIFCLTAGLYALIRALELESQGRQRALVAWSVCAGLLLTMAVLTRTIAILLPPFLLVLLVARNVLERWRLNGLPMQTAQRAVAISLGLPIIAVGMVIVKNSVLFDRPIVSTGSGTVLWLGSRADTEGDDPPYRGKQYDTDTITQGASHLSPAGDARLMQAAKQNIREAGIDYAWWSFKKIGRLLVGNANGWFFPRDNLLDWMRAHGHRPADAALMVAQVLLATFVAVFGVLGLLILSNGGQSQLLGGALVFYFVILSIPFMVIQRFGIPLVPWLSLAACGLAWSLARAGRFVHLSLGLCLVFGIVFLICI